VKKLLEIAAVIPLCLGVCACEGVAVDDDAPGQEESALVAEGTYDALGVLRVANTLEADALDGDVGLDARAARNIASTRSTHGEFATLAALDAVPYVGDAAMDRMRAYAAAQGWIGRCGDGVVQAGPEQCDGSADCTPDCHAMGGVPDPGSAPAGALVNGVAEGSVDARAILAVANQATLAQLDDDAALDSRSARNIVAGRPYASLAALDAVPYVTDKVFQKLLAYANAQGAGEPGGPPYQDTPLVQGIREGSYEAFGVLRAANESTLEQLDADAGLDVRAAKAIFHGHEANGNYASLAALDAVPYVGRTTFDDLLAYARARNLLPSCGDHQLQPVMEQCDGGIGCSADCRITYHCGDGALEPGEECDDGNHASADGCSSTCHVEVLNATWNNRTAETAAVVGSYRHLGGVLNGENDQRWFRLTVDRPTHLQVDVYSGRGDRCQWFYFDDPEGQIQSDIFEPAMALRAVNGQVLQNFGASCGEKYSADQRYDLDRQLVPGTYFISLTGQDVGAGWDSDYSVGFSIDLVVVGTGPVCGNGQVEDGEECDDGNAASGDGCNTACRVETLAEGEPNDDAAHARFFGTYRYAAGSINRAGDEDWFSVRVEEGQSLTAELSDGAGGCGFDSRLEVYDANGVQVAWDDDDGPGYCSRLDPTRDPSMHGMPAGVYRLRVRHADARIATGSYRLEVVVR
jgi:cysteine-rich repeat protein